MIYQPALRRLLGIAILFCALLLAMPVSHAEGKPQQIPDCRGRDLLADLKAEDPQAYERWIEAARAIPNGEAVLWRIDGNGLTEPSWLFGTMHTTDPRIINLPPMTDEAFQGARSLVVEIKDLDNRWKDYFNSLFAAPEIYLPHDKTWRDYLNKSELQLMEDELAAYGHSMNNFERMQPWTAALYAFSYPNCEAWRIYLGLDYLDALLAKRARRAGKPVIGIETRYESAKTIAAMNIETQFRMMMAGAKVSGGAPEDTLETYIQAYLDRIPAYLEYDQAPYDLNAEEVAALREFIHYVVDRRNLTMRDRSLPLIKEGRAFIAVGSAHLPGDQGLVELFRKAGYEVTPVN